MKKIYIKTTETCQLKCDHCYVGDNRKVEGFFDEDKTIAWLKEYATKFNIMESDILFSFHGGEPFLCPLDKMQKVVDAFPIVTYDATTNLCFPLTEELLNFIKHNFVDKYNRGWSFIKTSWDHRIRFHHEEELSLWEKNIKILLNERIEVRVIICLTRLLISEIEPVELLVYFLELGITDIHFERLTENTTSDKSLVPDYIRQDEWLLDFYNVSKGKITVDMFEELKHACNRIFINCRNRHCMREVITINANGTIGGCPNSAIGQYYTDISKSPNDICRNPKRQQLMDNEQKREVMCYMCDLYQICNGDCHQLSWQDYTCVAPKKLIRRIQYDLEREKETILPNS